MQAVRVVYWLALPSSPPQLSSRCLPWPPSDLHVSGSPARQCGKKRLEFDWQGTARTLLGSGRRKSKNRPCFGCWKVKGRPGAGRHRHPVGRKARGSERCILQPEEEGKPVLVREQKAIQKAVPDAATGDKTWPQEQGRGQSIVLVHEPPIPSRINQPNFFFKSSNPVRLHTVPAKGSIQEARGTFINRIEDKSGADDCLPPRQSRC